MKKLLLQFFVLCGILFISASANAQVQVRVNLNVESQPQWGPVGYDYVNYYYLPDIDVYYNVPLQQYVYLRRGRWIFAASLPGRYRTYDLYRGYKVVVNDPDPYRHPEVYRERYGRYRGQYGQQEIIRDYPYGRSHGNEDRHGEDHPRNHGRGHDKHHRDGD